MISKRKANQAGQSTIEYVLLIAVVISLAAILIPGLAPLITKVETEFRTRYKATYRYGDPRTKGFDDGGPMWHARASTVGGGGGTGNFRLHKRNSDER